MLAYGLSFGALSTDEPTASVRRHDWHEVSLRQDVRPVPSVTQVIVEEERAILRAQNLATISVSRSPLEVVVCAPHPFSDAALSHPLLSFVGAVAARWTGRSAFHGAAVVFDGAAWILLGGPGSGKTTLSWQLHAAGHPVLADDLSVVTELDVLAGPRSGDLRTEAATHLDRGEELTEFVGRRRWRVTFGSVPQEVRLGGFVELTWADRLSVEPVAVGERLQTLARHEALGLGPSAHRSFLDLLTVPMWRLSRPTDWHSSRPAADAVVQIARAAR